MMSNKSPVPTAGRNEVLKAICDKSAIKLKKVNPNEIKDRSAPITDTNKPKTPGLGQEPPIRPSMSSSSSSGAVAAPKQTPPGGGGSDLASQLANHKFKNRTNNDNSPPVVTVPPTKPTSTTPIVKTGNNLPFQQQNSKLIIFT